MRYADKERNAVICILFALGFDTRTIAEVFGISRRRVNQIIADQWGARMPQKGSRRKNRFFNLGQHSAVKMCYFIIVDEP